MIEISPLEAKHLLENSPDKYLLVDVREDVELKIAAIEDTIHIPMGEIPSRIDELDSKKAIICLCKTGGRSGEVGHYLLNNGFNKVMNLSGGINAWSEQVDPSIPIY
ncbi:MAG: rhodanese-like domain-containing protein [Pseudomonadota bacterium]|nr:rhodanese-like domain-containing protein [Pseudomonadota bacterium]